MRRSFGPGRRRNGPQMPSTRTILGSGAAPALALMLLGPALAEKPAEYRQLPEPVGVARLVMPDGATAPPLVVVLPDALGEDGRAEHYVNSLLARGIATLVLGLGEDIDASPSPVEPTASPAAATTAVGWADGAGFGPIGLLGFGLGGRAALVSAEGLPAAALYPGCDAPALPAQVGAALIVQGALESGGCDDLPPRAGIEMRLLPGAGHGWDVPGAIWSQAGLLLADPAGGGFLRTRADHDATLAASEAVADWFEQRLFTITRRASR